MMNISNRDAKHLAMSTADLDQRRLDEALSALGEQLEAAGARFELVVIGGSALAALGLVLRTTRDVVS